MTIWDVERWQRQQNFRSLKGQNYYLSILLGRSACCSRIRIGDVLVGVDPRGDEEAVATDETRRGRRCEHVGRGADELDVDMVGQSHRYSQRQPFLLVGFRYELYSAYWLRGVRIRARSDRRSFVALNGARHGDHFGHLRRGTCSLLSFRATSSSGAGQADPVAHERGKHRIRTYTEWREFHRR